MILMTVAVELNRDLHTSINLIKNKQQHTMLKKLNEIRFMRHCLFIIWLVTFIFRTEKHYIEMLLTVKTKADREVCMLINLVMNKQQCAVLRRRQKKIRIVHHCLFVICRLIAAALVTAALKAAKCLCWPHQKSTATNNSFWYPWRSDPLVTFGFCVIADLRSDDWSPPL